MSVVDHAAKLGWVISDQTSMHSSRTRTARLLPVSPSLHCAGGCLPWGSAPEGVCSLVGMLLGGLLSGGSAPGWVCFWGCIPACNGQTPHFNRILDTRYRKYYLAPTSLRAVPRLHKPYTVQTIL